MKDLVFIVNGAGLGNATRCDSIIEKLSYDKITIFCSGNSYEYFSKKTGSKLNLIKLNCYQFQKGKSGDISFLKTILCLPFYLNILLRNLRIIHREFKQLRPKVVISDSDYSFVFLRLFCKAKIIAINNSPNIIHNLRYSKRFIFSCFAQFIIECMDYLLHYIFAEHILCPSFNSKDFDIGKVTFIPPLVRNSFYEQSEGKNEGVKQIGLIPSGSSSSIDQLVNINSLKQVEVKYFIPSSLEETGLNIERFEKFHDNSFLFKQADLIICNAGMSSLSEIFITGVPAIIIPVKNHFEQITNSILISTMKNNMAVSHSKEICPEVIKGGLTQSKDPCNSSGVDKVISIINSFY